jgi:hypothetical protein
VKNLLKESSNIPIKYPGKFIWKNTLPLENNKEYFKVKNLSPKKTQRAEHSVMWFAKQKQHVNNNYIRKPGAGWLQEWIYYDGNHNARYWKHIIHFKINYTAKELNGYRISKKVWSKSIEALGKRIEIIRIGVNNILPNGFNLAELVIAPRIKFRRKLSGYELPAILSVLTLRKFWNQLNGRPILRNIQIENSNYTASEKSNYLTEQCR